MTKRNKVLAIGAASLAGLILLLGIAAILVVRTDWFREYVRGKIVSATEEGTGGKVDVGAFSFDVSHMRAVVSNFVIHGTEPTGAAPLLSVARVEVDIRLFTSIKHLLDITYLGVQKPLANIMVFPDGRTNIPTPKQKTSSSNTTALQSLIDLAVGHFDLTNGAVSFNSQKQQLEVHGNNLRAELWFNVLTRNYSGKLGMEPLYVISGRNTPVTFRLTLPVTLEGDRITLKDASITSPDSNLAINGSLENLKDPKINAHLSGHIGLADLKNAGNLPIFPNTRNAPTGLDVDANASASGDRVTVTGLRLGMGHSTIEASGPLKDPRNAGGLAFKASLDAAELGRLLHAAVQPEGTLEANGQAKLDASNNYLVTGNLQTRNLSFIEDHQRIGNIAIASAMHLDPHRAELQGLRLSAFGGEFLGNILLEEFARYRVNGNLRNLDIQTAARTFGLKQLAYDGVISGPVDVSGAIDAPGTKGVTASARLSIAPGKRGIPVSGRLNANYDGKADSVSVENSYLALPHTRLALSGSLNKRLNVTLTTRDLNDILAAAALTSKPPVTLNGGQATFTGTVMGSLTNPKIAGQLEANQFSVEGRQFNTLAANISASSTGAALTNGSLTRGPMTAQFTGSVGLRNWSALPREPLSANLSLTNGDLADVVVLAGQPPAGYSGGLTATAHVEGTVGNPRGSANVRAANGTLAGEGFDTAVMQVNLTDQLVTVPSAYITAGPGRVDLSAEFQHPRDSFTTGHVHAHVQSNQLNLALIRSVQKQQPNSAGQAQLNADLTGDLSQVKGQSEFLLTQVNADASARGLRLDGQSYGDLTAAAHTAGQNVTYNVASNFAGSDLHVTGNTRLVAGYPTTADATLAHLPIERVLRLAKQTAVPARGNLSGSAHFAGTIQNPQGSVDLDLANAVIYDEPLDHVLARINYLPTSIDVSRFEIAEGAARIDLTGRFDHPANNLEAGNVQFKVQSTRIDLAKVQNAQKLRPGLGGVLEIAATGAGTIQKGAPRLQLNSLNGNVGATGVSVQHTNVGDLTLKVSTTTGNKLSLALNSNLGGAAINGQGTAQISGDYPLDVRLTFNNVDWNRMQPLLGGGTGAPSAFDAVADGVLAVNGPAMKLDQLHGLLQVTRLNVDIIPARGAGKALSIRNQGPIELALDKGTVTIANAHLTGPQTDIQATGTASIAQQTLSANLNANANLGLLQSFDKDIVASGAIVATTTIRGSFAKPLINGQLQLKNASLNYTTLPNGISNANGVIAFNGTNATIRNLTGETGGGKVTASGFVGFADVLRFGLRTQASNVRVRIQQGVSAVADADIHLTGTMAASIVSGSITIDQLNYAPQSDIGAMLSRSATPVQSEAAPSPLLDNMKLDVRVRTSPTLGVQASLAQNLQANADLRVRGTAAQPGVLGRITISEGELVFFGSTYTVNSGTISFYDPIRIQPILNISLETQAKGVDVVITVTGPVDNMKLSYTSDPPLQFQEIIGLLASGKTPTSDPTLLANQPSTPSQSYEQMGESAIVGKALADPVTNRLQRVFGITQLKIDPAFTSGSQLPTARLTFQQQVTSNVTFTYTSALDDPNSTIIRAEWSFNPQYSAVATRDQNGLVSVVLFYKKQFR